MVLSTLISTSTKHQGAGVPGTYHYRVQNGRTNSSFPAAPYFILFSLSLSLCSLPGDCYSKYAHVRMFTFTFICSGQDENCTQDKMNTFRGGNCTVLLVLCDVRESPDLFFSLSLSHRRFRPYAQRRAHKEGTISENA